MTIYGYRDGISMAKALATHYDDAEYIQQAVRTMFDAPALSTIRKMREKHLQPAYDYGSPVDDSDHIDHCEAMQIASKALLDAILDARR